jgi:hypothetical protein
MIGRRIRFRFARSFSHFPSTRLIACAKLMIMKIANDRFRSAILRGAGPRGCGRRAPWQDARSAIRDPDKPIGTHVFTAMVRNDAGLRWTAVTIDNGDNAKDALDRITVPQDVLDRIAPTVLPRSSFIVSDEPLSRETNNHTEFVAVLHNQPHGGFVTHLPAHSISEGNARRRGG